MNGPYVVQKDVILVHPLILTNHRELVLTASKVAVTLCIIVGTSNMEIHSAVSVAEVINRSSRHL